MLAATAVGAADKSVPWQEGNAYSSSFLYNGFAYKIIRIFHNQDPSTGRSVGVAIDASQSCPGKSGKCMFALVLVENEGTRPFDVDPKTFSCECGGKKSKVLSLYNIPSYLRSATPPGFLLLGNIVAPSEHLRGAVIFGGTCADLVVRIPIVVAGQRLVFEFPFTRK